MARIPEEELGRLKREVPLSSLAARAGLGLKRMGNDLVARCPFHGDNGGDTEPSFHISPDKNLYHCFGCGKGGDNLRFLQETEGISFRHAVERLRSMAGGNEKAQGLGEVREALKFEAESGKLLGQVVELYHKNLLEKPEAKEYLTRRGLGSAELWERFRLGYADRSLGYHLGKDSNSPVRQQLRQLGVLRAETGHEHMSGRIVIPIVGPSGETLGLYGRRVRDDLKPGSPKHLYLPGPHRGIWNEAGLVGQEEIILCEALFDALTLHLHGFCNVTAAYGTQGLTPQMAELLKERKARVLLAFDSDEAGERAAAEHGERLLEEGLSVYRVEVPAPCKDINEYALAHGSEAGRMLALLLGQARPMGQSPPRPASGGADVAPAHQRRPFLVQEQLKQLEQLEQLAAFAAKEGKRQEQDASKPDETERKRKPTAPTLAAVAAPLAPLKVEGDRGSLRLGSRLWVVRGLEKLGGPEALKLGVQCTMGEAFHLDTLDLQSAKARGAFLRQAAEELGVEEAILKADMGKLLGAVEEHMEKRLGLGLKGKPHAPALSEKEQEEALALLRNPRLLELVLSDFERIGFIGEDNNKLLVYLACSSRKLPRPLAVLVQSNSAAGKSTLVEAVLSFMPEEDVIQYSALTGQALYYLEERSLSGKVLCIAEEEGAQRAAYALKQLLSEGKLSIATPGKDPLTGKQVTHEYSIHGIPALLSTTTREETDEELANRCLVLGVDEGREQTQAIHQQQRKSRSLDGLWAKEIRQDVLRRQKNLQRLLQPMHVVNPFWESLTFLDDRTRTRRDHPKYLSLIEAIAFVHQFQRPVKTAFYQDQVKHYIEALPSDIALANRLMNEALGRSLDELAPQTRRLLHLLEKLCLRLSEEQGVKLEEVRFRAKDARAFTGWSATQVKRHLNKLAELEYLVAHRAPRGQHFLYEMLYDGQGKDGKPFVLGLLEPGRLSSSKAGREYDPHRDGVRTKETGERSYRKPIESLSKTGLVQEAREPEDAGAEEAKTEDGPKTHKYRESEEAQPAPEPAPHNPEPRTESGEEPREAR